jgi:hypothetical protein
MLQILGRFGLAMAFADGALAIGAAASAAPYAAPPAAPIFYCPTLPAASLAAQRPRDNRTCPRDVGRHAMASAERSRRHGGEPARGVFSREGPDGVAESQAFIYRYELALGGLDARAAEAAWRHPDGYWPGCPPSSKPDCPKGASYPSTPPPATQPAAAARTPPAPPRTYADEAQAQWQEEKWSYRASSDRGDLGSEPRREGYLFAGRDRLGYLTWPGKTPQEAP